MLLTIDDFYLEEKIQELIELDKYKDQVLANVTHDLRTPLNGMLFLINEVKAPHSINVTGLLSVDFKIHKGKQVLACQPPCCHLTGWRLGLLMDTSY